MRFIRGNKPLSKTSTKRDKLKSVNNVVEIEAVTAPIRRVQGIENV